MRVLNVLTAAAIAAVSIGCAPPPSTPEGPLPGCFDLTGSPFAESFEYSGEPNVPGNGTAFTGDNCSGGEFKDARMLVVAASQSEAQAVCSGEFEGSTAWSLDGFVEFRSAFESSAFVCVTISIG